MKCWNTGRVIRKRHKKFLNIKFWGICIPLRIGLGIAIWYISQINEKADLAMAILVTIGGLIGMYKNFICLCDKTAWWSRRFEFIISLMLVIFGSISIGFWLSDKRKSFHSKFLSIIIFIDVFVAIIMALINNNQNKMFLLE